VTHRLGRLLPTIRSRCRILRFAPLSDGAVDRILKAQARRPMDRRAAAAAAQGRRAWRWISPRIWPQRMN
jgi:DNA polymerase-3 subunit delta'